MTRIAGAALALALVGACEWAPFDPPPEDEPEDPPVPSFGDDDDGPADDGSAGDCQRWEDCNGLDDDCDGLVDEDDTCWAPADDDADGSDPDCGWSEECNGVDDDCDGLTDEDDVCWVDDGFEEVCDNVVDDDGDGWSDCSDLDCSTDSFCRLEPEPDPCGALLDCFGWTVDVLCDPLNCGDCGIVCELGVECISGFCGGP